MAGRCEWWCNIGRGGGIQRTEGSQEDDVADVGLLGCVDVSAIRKRIMSQGVSKHVTTNQKKGDSRPSIIKGVVASNSVT